MDDIKIIQHLTYLIVQNIHVAKNSLKKYDMWTGSEMLRETDVLAP